MNQFTVKLIKKIKIVHIISNLSLGGAQVLVFDILKNLKKKNDLELSVITIDSGEYIENYNKAGIKVYDLKEKGLVNPKIYSKLKKILKEINPDIVHTHLNKADFYGRIAAKRAGVPVIVSTCHNYSTTHDGADVNKKSMFDRIDDLVISYSGSFLIAISEVVKQYLINRNSKFENITEIIYNGVNINKEKYILQNNELSVFRKKFNISDDDYVITISGRIEKQKGHSFFIESVKDFLKEKKNIRILFLGDGSLKKDIETLVKADDLSEYVEFLGFQKEPEKFIEISDLICVPSLWEGFGLVVIEGMIKRKIVLASDVGGIPEIIISDVNGFLFESLNKNSLLENLEKIYNCKIDPEMIRENALNTVKNKFDIQKNSELYYQSYLKKIRNLKNT